MKSTVQQNKSFTWLRILFGVLCIGMHLLLRFTDVLLELLNRSLFVYSPQVSEMAVSINSTFNDFWTLLGDSLQSMAVMWLLITGMALLMNRGVRLSTITCAVLHSLHAIVRLICCASMLIAPKLFLPLYFTSADMVENGQQWIWKNWWAFSDNYLFVIESVIVALVAIAVCVLSVLLLKSPSSATRRTKRSILLLLMLFSYMFVHANILLVMSDPIILQLGGKEAVSGFGVANSVNMMAEVLIGWTVPLMVVVAMVLSKPRAWITSLIVVLTAMVAGIVYAVFVILFKDDIFAVYTVSEGVLAYADRFVMCGLLATVIWLPIYGLWLVVSARGALPLGMQLLLMLLAMVAYLVGELVRFQCMFLSFPLGTIAMGLVLITGIAVSVIISKIRKQKQAA